MENLEKAYAVRYKIDDTKLFNSTSGGAFLGIAEYVISRGGAVYGAAYNECNEVEHVRIDSLKFLYRLQGSKYVQSKIGDCYKLAQQDLMNGVEVLFTGTPCQIAGLKGFLKKNYDNLLTLDFACHGVPSPRFFKYYLEWIEEREKTSIPCGGYVFRYKKYGWYYRRKMSYVLKFGNKTRHISVDPYYSSFLKANNYRESCYVCPFRIGNYQSDITVGDFNNVDIIYPDFMDSRGVSYLIAHNTKANSYFEYTKHYFDFLQVELNCVVENNTFLTKNAIRKTVRNNFYKGMENNPIQFVEKIYKKIGIKTKLKGMILSKIPCSVVKRWK